MSQSNKYNPNIHHRKSIRLKGYDYSQAGLYFITVCCHNRICRFGEIENGKMLLNEYGMVAHNEWIKLQERFTHFELDVFQIMPNHMHAIIALNPSVGATLAVDQNDNVHIGGGTGAGASPAPTASDMVGAYKSLAANGCLEIYKSKNEIMGKLWQRNFYEHIIRNEQSYNAISNYIINNPSNWKDDKFFM